MHPRRRLTAIRTRTSASDGFTLIELLVVITILGILAGIVVFAVKGIGDKGDANSRLADASILRTAEEANCAQHGSYTNVQGLIDNRLLAGRPSRPYHSINLGTGGKCGTGGTSSFSIVDDTAPTTPDAGFTAVDGATAIVVDSSTDKVYVGSATTNNVTVINGATGAVVDTIDVGGNVRLSDGPTMAVNPANHKVYVALTDGTVVVIDGTNDHVSSPITPPGENGAITIDPVNNKAYLSGPISGVGTQASYLDGDTNALTPLDDSNGDPFGPLVANTTTNKLYAWAQGYTRLLIVDGATDTVTQSPVYQTFDAVTTATSSPVMRLKVDSATNRVYAMVGVSKKATTSPPAQKCTACEKLFVINGVDNSLITTQMGTTTSLKRWGMLLDPGKNRLWVSTDPANTGSFVLTEWDGAANAYTQQAPLPGATRSADQFDATAVLNPDNNRIYMAQPVNGGLMVFDTARLTTTTLLPGRDFGGVVVNTNNNRIYALQESPTFGVQAFTTG